MRLLTVSLTICLLLIGALALPAQTVNKNYATIGAGTGPSGVTGFATMAVCTENGATCSITSFNSDSKDYSARTGVAKRLLHLTSPLGGYISVYGLGDAGMEAGTDNLGGAFGAGGFVSVDVSHTFLGRVLKLPDARVVFVGQNLHSAINGSRPQYSFGFSGSF